ncbi:hypothetical protein [Plasmodium yoelii yoelii]|uniref:Uncharacterized protein n=3 Tax=Plasmodium yoelii TaxID=5861 RepID=A0AAE9WKS8_PLAYO|nr:hypothetical protein [Plasmodium yoelii yoelii]WBY54786.1 hypothetical protein Py17XNL_000202692 [Plasmodium yoelii yoelii]
MSSRVQLKSTKLQHRKRPRKKKKSEIYRTPVLYHPNQKDYFNLQSEYICLPDVEILNLLSKNKLHELINAIKNKDNNQINNILYKDINNIYIDPRYIYYHPSFVNNDDPNQLLSREKNSILKDTNFDKNYVIDAENEKNNQFVDVNNIYFYFKKVNITNINKDNINDDIYKELKELKKISMEKGDPIGYNIYKYFLNLITNVDRFKYIDNFFLVDYINNIWASKNVHKYFYFLNSLYDRMKKISYKLFNLNYKIDQIDHNDEKNKMVYFERHELFNKVIKKTKFIPNYILKHNYIYSNNILNLYQYDITSNSFVNKFESTYTPVLLTDFLDPEKKKNLNIYYNLNAFDSYKTYSHTYPRNNQLKQVMQITYGEGTPQSGKNDTSYSVHANDDPVHVNDDSVHVNDDSVHVNDDSVHANDDSVHVNDDPVHAKNRNSSNQGKQNNEQNNELDNRSSWVDRIKKDKKIKYEILEKISEKMYSEFLEMNIIDNQNKIDLNKINDIKNDKNSLLYKKVYAMRDYFYNLIYDNYKPNLDIYELETFIDAEYRTYSYKKDLDVLFKNWVLNENKQLPTIQFAKKDVELAKTRLMSKRKRKIIEFDQLVYERHSKRQNDTSQNGKNNDNCQNGKNNGNCQDKVIKKSINCLIKWNVRSENDSTKKKPNEDENEEDENEEDENEEDDDGEDYDGDYDDENYDENYDDDIKSHGFCDEELEGHENDSKTPFCNMKFGKLVIYDNNYNNKKFVETLMTYIPTCDYQRANEIYNSLKIKGKNDTLYFKNYERAENIAFLLRQSPEKIIADVEFL